MFALGLQGWWDKPLQEHLNLFLEPKIVTDFDSIYGPRFGLGRSPGASVAGAVPRGSRCGVDRAACSGLNGFYGKPTAPSRLDGLTELAGYLAEDPGARKASSTGRGAADWHLRGPTEWAGGLGWAGLGWLAGLTGGAKQRAGICRTLRLRAAANH